MTGVLDSSVIEVSLTPGSLFQRRNYGLDRWKIASNSGLREGQRRNRTWDRYAAYLCAWRNVTCDGNAETRAAESVCATIYFASLFLSFFLFLKSCISRFLGTVRVARGPGIWHTCRALSRIDNSLCAAQCLSLRYFNTYKNPIKRLHSIITSHNYSIYLRVNNLR